MFNASDHDSGILLNNDDHRRSNASSGLESSLIILLINQQPLECLATSSSILIAVLQAIVFAIVPAQWPILEAILLQKLIESNGGVTTYDIFKEKAEEIWYRKPEYANQPKPEFSIG
jgi:hypothetical protein